MLRLIIGFITWLTHIHRWSQWRTPFQYGWEDYQRKTCFTCGKAKQRNVGWTSRGQ